MASAADWSAPERAPAAPARVAVCMSGRTRSLAYTRDVVMPSYVKHMERPLTDLFVLLGDRLLVRGEPPIAEEEAHRIFQQARSLRSFHLSSFGLRVPTDWGHSMCAHFVPRRMGQPGTAVQMLKLPGVFAAVLREERLRGERYDFVVRTRPDLLILVPLPPIPALFTNYSVVQPGKKGAAVLSGLPAPADESAAPAPREPVAADIVTWDDQFAIARRDAAEALMVGVRVRWGRHTHAPRRDLAPRGRSSEAHARARRPSRLVRRPPRPPPSVTTRASGRAPAASRCARRSARWMPASHRRAARCAPSLRILV